MPNFSPTIIFAGGSGTTLLVVLFLLIKYPDRVQTWIGILSRVFNYIFKKSEYFSIKWEIEGKLNTFAGNLETDGGVPYSRLAIKWTGRDEEEEIAFEDGQTIIVMRDRNHRNKNFVHAAYFYTSEILLKNTKRKLPKHLKTSINLYSTQKIIQQENKAALNQFINDYLIPNVDQNDKIKEYIERFNKIETIGLYFPVLIQELTYLGNKVYLSTQTEKIIKEVELLIQFLETWSEREIGQITQEEFTGSFTKCSIKIVASQYSRTNDKIDNQKGRIINSFNQGIENVYVIGNSAKENKKFVDKVVRACTTNNPKLLIMKKREFTAKVKSGEIRKTIPNYLVHVRNPEAIEYVNQ